MLAGGGREFDAVHAGHRDVDDQDVGAGLLKAG